MQPANGRWDSFAVAGDSISPGTHSLYEILFKKHDARIRQSGVVREVEFYLNALPVGELRVRFWRRRADGSDLYDLVGETEDLTSKCSVPGVNRVTIDPPGPLVLEGDYYSLYVTGDGLTDPGTVAFATASLSDKTDGWYADDSDPPLTTGFDWENAQFTDDDIYWQCRVYLRAPQIVSIGHSNMAGHNDHWSFIENLDVDGIDERTAPHMAIGRIVADNLRATSQNMGHGGHNSALVRNRFQEDVVDLDPGLAIVICGAGDILQNSEAAIPSKKQNFLDNWTAIADMCEANGVYLVACEIEPITLFSDQKHVYVDEWNTALDSALIAHPWREHIVLVHLSDALGQERPTGPPGNRWDIKTAFDDDGAHYTKAGRQRWAQEIWSALVANKWLEPDLYAFANDFE